MGGADLKFRVAIVALAASPTFGACTTVALALVGAALSLCSDLEYLDGDCAFSLHKYHDSQGHHHCSFSDDEYHQHGTGHHHDKNSAADTKLLSWSSPPALR
jgi:hypothetical protein